MGARLLALFALGATAVWAFRTIARKSFPKQHGPQELAEIYSKIQDQVSPEVFHEVWSKIAEAFAIDPRLVRPDDTLSTLSSIDSWDLGKGEDALDQWIEQSRMGKPPELTTVLDLARWIQTSKVEIDRQN